MLEQQVKDGLIRFGAFEIDVCTGELHKYGTRVRLQDQPFRVLQLLLERPGEVVTRSQLQRRIWPSDTFVDFDKGLNNAVKRLRDALGDSADTPRYVETVARRGYRFIGPIQKSEPTSAGDSATQSRQVVSRPQFRRRFFFLAVPTLGGLGGLLFLLDAGGWRSAIVLKFHPPSIRSIAVLPLQNLSADATQDYFADGMTDGLITELSHISSVRVISRTSVMRYRKSEKTASEIGRELAVDGIIEGTVQRTGNRVRITTQLIYAPSERHLWADVYERKVEDVFALERDLTQQIARQIKARVISGDQVHFPEPRAMNLVALEAYLQGRNHLDKAGQGFGDEEHKKAAEFFEQAIQADPVFLQAYEGLAEAHRNLLLPSREDSAAAERVREKIVELAPNSSIAAMLSAMEKAEKWEWAGAEAEFRKAIELEPNNVEAHRVFAKYLDDLGRLDEGWKELEVAQQLDPYPDRLPSALDLPEALAVREKCDQAVVLALRILETNPKDGQTHLLLSQCYERLGRYKEAIDELGQTCALYGHPEIQGRLNNAYRLGDYQGALRTWAREIERLQAAKQVFLPAYLAGIYGRLGDKDKAFYWFEQAYRFRGSNGLGSSLVHWLMSDFTTSSIRKDQRYFDLLRRVGLLSEGSARTPI